MGLLERVTTLVRANLNDLIDRAEDPEKMLKQVILDMQNQLMQVKTQVAISIADQHLLEKKVKENDAALSEWIRKAELALEKNRDDLARAAAERILSHKQLGQSFGEQLEDQKAQVENLKTALRKLEQKLVEAQAKSDVLRSQHRRARALSRATDARAAMGSEVSSNAFDRMKDKVERAEATSEAKVELATDNLHEQLVSLGKEEQVDQILNEIKARKGVA
jgi:phage shock protein A